MEAFAISKFNRLSTKKLQRVAKVINHMNYRKALGILDSLPQKGAKLIGKTLKSAGANLQNKEPDSKEESWLIKTIIVNRGSYFKRVRPRARGRADRIQKPTTHLKVIVVENDDQV